MKRKAQRREQGMGETGTGDRGELGPRGRTWGRGWREKEKQARRTRLQGRSLNTIETNRSSVELPRA